jgi:hypothetical protein
MLVRLWDIDKNPPQKLFIDLKKTNSNKRPIVEK